ncbi:unnamed protein product [Aureobasidium vineae]|uniref:Uncharacterized protein n=1 Tax=Aureobasidium vineae TaxID=2773715 RepID=A0A9N8P4K2_9PEZI|nr:unnamed protein product [Aureobasidium vineae]
MNLLKERYGINPAVAAMEARSAAETALLSVTRQDWKGAMDKLKKVRAMIYEDNEEAALWNAEVEEWRRMMDASKQRQKQEIESRLAAAQPWVKRLWEEDQGKKSWGYAVFRDPEAVNEEYGSRMNDALMHAREAIGCGDTIAARWRLQNFDWPSIAALDQDTDTQTDGESTETVDEEPKHEEPQVVSDDQDSFDKEATSQLEANFQVLRERFKVLRKRASGRQIATVTQTDRAALQSGILRNVFIVINQPCVDSLFSDSANVDDMWIWAVDPDYIQPATTDTPDAPSDQYRGYLRVRLQQLVNNFFDARRFLDNYYSMEALWQAAQPSKNQAFVSVREPEQKLWMMSRSIGSGIRPEGVVRATAKLLY